MVSWWLLSQETGGLPTSLILVFVWGLETYHVGTFWCLASHAASSSVSYIYSAPWLHRFKKKSHFLGVFWQIPNVSKWYLCEFSTADPNCWDPVSLFFLNFSQDFHPPYQLVTKQSFPTKFGLGKTERTSLVTSPTYIRGTSFQSLVLRNADLVLSEGESRCQDAGFCCGKIEGVGISL